MGRASGQQWAMVGKWKSQKLYSDFDGAPNLHIVHASGVFSFSHIQPTNNFYLQTIS